MTCKIDKKQYLGHWETNWSKDVFYKEHIRKNKGKKVDKNDLEKINELINGYINDGETKTADQILIKLSSKLGNVFYNDNTKAHKPNTNLPISDHLKVLIKHLLSIKPEEIKKFIKKEQEQEEKLEEKQAKNDKLAAQLAITRTTSSLLDDKKMHDLKFKDLRDFYDITFVDEYSPEALVKWHDWLQPEIEFEPTKDVLQGL